MAKISHGILHPKHSRHFRVYFSGEINRPALPSDAAPGERLDYESLKDEAKATFAALSSQVVVVDLPARTFATGGLKLTLHKNFKHTIHNGSLKIKLQDDVTNEVEQALEFIVDNIRNLSVTIVKVNGNEEVLESFVFANCKLVLLEHSQLSYGAASTNLSGYIEHPEQHENHAPVTSRISAQISDANNDAVVHKTLTLEPLHSFHAVFGPEDNMNCEMFL